MVLFLGRPYIWPGHDLDRHLTLAANRREEISRLSEIAESSEIMEEIQTEIQELRSRIKTSGRSSQVAPPSRKWWQFWK
jgi:hypothetical protein